MPYFLIISHHVGRAHDRGRICICALDFRLLRRAWFSKRERRGLCTDQNDGHHILLVSKISMGLQFLLIGAWLKSTDDRRKSPLPNLLESRKRRWATRFYRPRASTSSLRLDFDGALSVSHQVTFKTLMSPTWSSHANMATSRPWMH